MLYQRFLTEALRVVTAAATPRIAARYMSVHLLRDLVANILQNGDVKLARLVGDTLRRMNTFVFRERDERPVPDASNSSV